MSSNDAVQMKHVEALMKQVNVLNNKPATVNGGLWFEINDNLPELKISYDDKEYTFGRATRSKLEKFKDGTVSFNDEVYFTFTGFTDGLVIDYSTTTNKGYEIKLADKIVGYLKVTLNDAKDTVTSYDFKFTDKAALDTSRFTTTAGHSTFSVKQVNADGSDIATGGVSYSLTLDVGALSSSAKEWEAADGGLYAYTVGGTAKYLARGGDSHSYTYTETGGDEKTIYVNIPALELSSSEMDKLVTISEEFDGTGEISKVIATFSQSAIYKLENPDEDADEDALYIADLDGQNINVVARLADDVEGKSTVVAGSFSLAGTSSYTFTAMGSTSGYIEHADGDGNAFTGDSDYSYIDTVKASGGDSFAITGLSSNLKLWYNETYLQYEIYAESDVNTKDGTVSSVKEGATILATITDGKAGYYGDTKISNYSVLTILDVKALASETSTVNLKDTQTSGRIFDLSMSSTLTEPTVTTTDAKFTVSGDSSYTYVPGSKSTPAHFERVIKTSGDPKGYQVGDKSDVTYQYVGASTVQTGGVSAFTITGLATGLSLSIAENSSSTRYPYVITDGSKIYGYISDRNNIVLTSYAIPYTSTSDQVVSLTSDTYKLYIAVGDGALSGVDYPRRVFHSDFENWTAEATAGTYTYTATENTSAWNTNGKELRVVTIPSGTTFTLNGLRTDLGTIAFDVYGYIHATNGSTIGYMLGKTITLYDTAVHKLFKPTITGTNASEFTLVLPS